MKAERRIKLSGDSATWLAGFCSRPTEYGFAKIVSSMLDGAVLLMGHRSYFRDNRRTLLRKYFLNVTNRYTAAGAGSAALEWTHGDNSRQRRRPDRKSTRLNSSHI